MKNLKKYITLNFLSFCGYIFLLFVFLLIFVFYPLLKRADVSTIEDSMYLGAGLVFFCLIFTAILVVIELFVCFIVFPIELVICKFAKIEPFFARVPEKFYKPHLYLFFVGLALSVLPVLLMLLYFFCL